MQTNGFVLCFPINPRASNCLTLDKREILRSTTLLHIFFFFFFFLSLLYMHMSCRSMSIEFLDISTFGLHLVFCGGIFPARKYPYSTTIARFPGNLETVKKETVQIHTQ